MKASWGRLALHLREHSLCFLAERNLGSNVENAVKMLNLNFIWCLVLSWNSNTLATWCEELTHLKRPWCWERLKAGGEGDDRGWDGWMASPTQWAWVWVNSGSWGWTGRPGVLQSMGSQRVRHDWATELKRNHLNYQFRTGIDFFHVYSHGVPHMHFKISDIYILCTLVSKEPMV